MALRTEMASAVWELVGNGQDLALDRLRGETGVGGVRLDAVCGPVHLVRARATVASRPGASPRDVGSPRSAGLPRTVRLAGGAYFQPDAACYGDTRLRPLVAVKSSNPLERLCRLSQERGLRIAFRVAALHQPALVERRGDVACVDAWGDASPARLCPSNPEVVAYVCGLVQDLSTHYPADRIDLADADFGRPHEFHPGRLGPAGGGGERCFCPSCRRWAKQAGIDVHAVIRASGLAAAGQVPPAEQEVVAAYDEMRRQIVVAFVRATAAACRVPLWAELGDAGWHRALASAAAGTIRVWDAGRDAAPTRAEGSAVQAGIRLPVGHAWDGRDGSAALVRAASQAVRDGVQLLVFESMETLPDERVDWVRQAVRYATRESTSIYDES